MDFSKPREWRKGQTLFNFLEWLGTKGYNSNQSYRMADPYHIGDKELESLYKEFLEEVER